MYPPANPVEKEKVTRRIFTTTRDEKKEDAHLEVIIDEDLETAHYP